VVDAVVKAQGGVATLFVKSGDQYVRVATTVKKDDGTSAVGTALDANSPAIAKLKNGEAYYGDATILGTNGISQRQIADKAGLSDMQLNFILALGVGFRNLNGLHRAIGLRIIEKPELISGAELRFLRKQLDMTQASAITTRLNARRADSSSLPYCSLRRCNSS
jgi:hypothetical protein